MIVMHIFTGCLIILFFNGFIMNNYFTVSSAIVEALKIFGKGSGSIRVTFGLAWGQKKNF